MINNLFTKFPLNESEQELINLSDTDQTHQISKAKVISDLYNTKKTEEFISKLIDSNEKLAASNLKSTRALNVLTVILVIIGIIQISIMAFH